MGLFMEKMIREEMRLNERMRKHYVHSFRHCTVCALRMVADCFRRKLICGCIHRRSLRSYHCILDLSFREKFGRQKKSGGNSPPP